MPGTEKQVRYVESLLAEREIDQANADKVLKKATAPETTPDATGKIIELLKELPRKPLPSHDDGLYMVNGTVYEVKTSQSSGNQYAKVLDKETGKFTYAPGSLRAIPADAHPMTLDEATEYGIAHGVCVKGHPLRNRTSVRLGIGPKCCMEIFGKDQKELLAERLAEHINSLEASSA